MPQITQNKTLCPRLFLIAVLLAVCMPSLAAQYAGGVGGGYVLAFASAELITDESCDCHAPAISGSPRIVSFPDCDTAGNYPNDFPLQLEFFAGATDHLDVFWMIEFRDLERLCSVYTYPFAEGDTMYKVLRTGNSLVATINFKDLDPEHSCVATGFEGYDWDYRLIRFCDYPVNNCYNRSERDTFEMQLSLNMFGVVSAIAKKEYGYCETTVPIDLLSGEILSIGNDSATRYWNDLWPSTQTLLICGEDWKGISVSENYRLVVRDSQGRAIDQNYLNHLIKDTGDSLVLDTVWLDYRRCLRLAYQTDGDGNFNSWQVFVGGEKLECNNPIVVGFSRMDADNFLLGWNAGMQARNHHFRLRIYRGSDCATPADPYSPNFDQTHVFETILSSDDSRLRRFKKVEGKETYIVVSDSFELWIADLGWSPEPCTCYQAFVYQICDGDGGSLNLGAWGGAGGISLAAKLNCAAMESGMVIQNEICGGSPGGIQFSVPRVFCVPFDVELLLSSNFIRDTFRFYSHPFRKGLPLYSDPEFTYDDRGNLVFSHLGRLASGDYLLELRMRDTLNYETVLGCGF